MRTLLDEVLEMEAAPQGARCICGCAHCSGYHPEWEMEDEVLEETNADAMAKAVTYNRKKSVELGWGAHFDAIVAKVLRLNFTPDESYFASLVADWQFDNGLTPDGMLGPGTWAKMKPLLGISSPSTTPAASYTRVFPMPELPDGRRPMITSGHHSVNPSRAPRTNPNNLTQAQCPSYLWYKGKCYSKPGYHGHQGADIFYRYQSEKDPPRADLARKKRITGQYWNPESVWALAYAPGIVEGVGEQSNGWVVKIRHPDGVQSRYLHLTKPIVKQGDQVQAGAPLAQLDRRGNPAHLHFEIRLKGQNHYMDTVNPAPYLQNLPYVRM